MKLYLFFFILPAAVLFNLNCKKSGRQGEKILAMTLKENTRLGVKSCGEALYNQFITEKQVETFRKVSALRAEKVLPSCEKESAVAMCQVRHDGKTFSEISKKTGRPDFDI